MYKSRIRKWKIDKKRKRPEMVFALKTIESRRQQGKLTRVTIRGNQTTEAEIRQYFKRQKTSATEDAVAYQAAPTPPEVEYGTPTVHHVEIPSKDIQKTQSMVGKASAMPSRSEPSGRLVQNNQDICDEPELFAPELAAETICWPVESTYPELQAVRSWSSLLDRGVRPKNKSQQTQIGGRGSSSAVPPYTAYSLEHFSSDPWSSSRVLALSTGEKALSMVEDFYTRYYFQSIGWARFANDTLFAAHFDTRQSILKHHNAVYADLNNPGHMTSSIEVAIHMFCQGKFETAGSLLESACAGVKALVIEQHPQLLSCLLVALSLGCTTQYPEVNQVVLRHFYDISLVLLGENHPLVQLSSHLARAIAENANLADRALNVLTDVFSAHAGPFHPASLKVMYTYAWSALRRHDTPQACRIFRYLQDVYEEKTSIEGAESRRVLYGLAQVHLAQGETALAKEILEEHQRRIEKRYGADTPVASKVEVLQMRALLCKRALDFEEMHVLQRQAYELGTQLLTKNRPTMVLLARDLNSCD
jgi:hypothetical protein